jgi:four helix bundle protein
VRQSSKTQPSGKPRVQRFEDLLAWQQARELARAVYGAANGSGFAKDFSLRNQICGAAVSVMSNIAEGFERAGRAEFHHFLVVAKGSCGEVRSQLYVALDAGYLTQAQFTELAALAERTAKLVSALRKAVQSQRDAAS